MCIKTFHLKNLHRITALYWEHFKCNANIWNRSLNFSLRFFWLVQPVSTPDLHRSTISYGWSKLNKIQLVRIISCSALCMTSSSLVLSGSSGNYSFEFFFFFFFCFYCWKGWKKRKVQGNTSDSKTWPCMKFSLTLAVLFSNSVFIAISKQKIQT